jgi:general stress protein 26
MASATQNLDHEQAIAKLNELIKGINVTMLVTQLADGSLHGRPMATQELESDGTLWFFTGASSGKVKEIQQDQHVLLSYAAPDDNRYVSVSGTAQMVRDRAKAKELWNPAFKAWFPDGLDDPELALLKVEVESAEYWDSPSSTIVHIVGFAKAVATGERYNPGDNATIEL